MLIVLDRTNHIYTLKQNGLNSASLNPHLGLCLLIAFLWPILASLHCPWQAFQVGEVARHIETPSSGAGFEREQCLFVDSVTSVPAKG